MLRAGQQPLANSCCVNAVPWLEQLFPLLSWVTCDCGCSPGVAQVTEVPLAVMSLGRRSCVPWRKVTAVFRAPARSPTGASRPRRTQPAGWPLSEGNGNCLLEPPALNQRVEAPAKRAGRAQKRQKQVIGKGFPVPEDAQGAWNPQSLTRRVEELGRAVRYVCQAGDRPRGVAVTAVTHSQACRLAA